MRRDQKNKRILGIDPCPRGFGFAVFDMPEFLCDWGVARVFGREAKAYLVRVTAMIDRYKPDVVTLPDPSDYPRKLVLRTLVAALTIQLARRRPDLRIVSREALTRAFPADARTKYERAVLLSRVLPELQQLLPRRRKIWESEDVRMNIFDALCLILTSPEGRIVLPSAAKESGYRNRPIQ